MNPESTLKYYHGGRNWIGPVEVIGKPGQKFEHGPGFYLTNGIRTAESYAKGGGVVQLIELSPDIRLMQDVKVDPQVLQDFLLDSPRIRNRSAIQNDIERCYQRLADQGDEQIGIDYLVNLMINHDALKPAQVAPLREFLVAQGADVDVFDAPGWCSYGGHRDEWMVVFNTDKILGRTLQKEAGFEFDNLPTFKEQMQTIGFPRRQPSAPKSSDIFLSDQELC